MQVVQSLPESEKSKTDGTFESLKVDLLPVEVGGSWLFHVRQYLRISILDHAAVGVEATAVEPTNALVPVGCTSLVGADPLHRLGPGQPLGTELEEFVPLCPDALAGEHTGLMSPLVTSDSNEAKLMGHQRDVALDLEQSKEGGLLLIGVEARSPARSRQTRQMDPSITNVGAHSDM